MRQPRHVLLALTLACLAVLTLFARDASAAGTFKLKSSEATEVSGAWHIYVTIELPKAPLTAHQSMKFHFTKTVAYERALIDGHNEPVLNKQALQNQSPSIESLDVDFADPSGKIFKGTRFDFGLTRTRGYEAGEYKVEVRTSDGVTIGSPQNITLKGDNPVVDRRAIAFNAKDPSVKKVDAYDGGANQAKNDNNEPSAANNMGEVTATGTAKPFIPKEGFEKTQEEEIKVKPSGCGCSVPGSDPSSPFGPESLLWLAPLAGIGVAFRFRRRRAAQAA
ncbi:MAG: MYXO-CTERM sorting domain-containing protein [Deltaproteobacteria bacterium]|nr:MYXO-CTERM sorting domain-containing protein [Deltaproteobacteria bacterium]